MVIVVIDKSSYIAFADFGFTTDKQRSLLYIPLTNRVRGPHCKLRPALFPIDLWPKREAYGPKIEGEKQGAIIYSTD